ncbi:hypothetical protein EYF80_051004 [Liparis tanakae]|uniref:Uncharacterized protein n=1 Tax=Liparis tanakae TaxID=230148 RepID=A0A4Z2FD38_9TELE|nr:hypothetical protein EYF80_051004 [Liparis tanakae]
MRGSILGPAVLPRGAVNVDKLQIPFLALKTSKNTRTEKYASQVYEGSVCNAGDPQRLLLGYPAPLIPPMPPHRPCLPPSTPPPAPPPTPVPLLLHWAKMPSPGPWAPDGSNELPVLSRLCHPELEGPDPPFPAPPAAEPPPSTPPPPPATPLSQLPPLPLDPTAEEAVGPEPADPAVAPPLPAPPAWECAM